MSKSIQQKNADFISNFKSLTLKDFEQDLTALYWIGITLLCVSMIVAAAQ